MSAKPILPNAGSRVRLRADGVDCLADVASTEDGVVVLTVTGMSGPGEILFSSTRGVVALSGELEPGETQTRLVVAELQWLEQRRETFRLAVGCAMTVHRAGGEEITGTVTDLSATGALLGDAAEPLSIDERVEVTIDAGPHGEVRVSGSVVRIDGPRRAVRFDSLPVNAQGIIERFLADEQRRRLQRRSG